MLIPKIIEIAAAVPATNRLFFSRPRKESDCAGFANVSARTESDHSFGQRLNSDG